MQSNSLRQVNAKQKSRLVELLATEKHKILLINKRSMSPAMLVTQCKEWANVTDELNSLGVHRTNVEWRQCFTNMKLNVHRKINGNRLCPQMYKYSAMDQTIMDICGSEFKANNRPPRLLTAAQPPPTISRANHPPPPVEQPQKCSDKEQTIITISGLEDTVKSRLTAAHPPPPITLDNHPQKATKNSTTVTSIQKEYLIHAFHSVRLSAELSFADAVRSPVFWTQVREQLAQRGHNKPESLWLASWQRLQSTLLQRIDTAIRQQRTDSSWLTPLNKRVLAVVLDALDEAQLAHVELCMADEANGDDAGLMACATVYQDLDDDRFVMKCQRCDETFAFGEADVSRFIAHIRRYKTGCVNTASDDDDASSSEDDDDEPVLIMPWSQPEVASVSSDDDDDDQLADVSMAHSDAIDPEQFGFVTDDEMSDEPIQKDQKQVEIPVMAPPDYNFDDFLLKLKSVGEMSTTDLRYIRSIAQKKTTKRAADADTNLLTTDIELMSYAHLPCTIEGCSMRFNTVTALNKHTMSVHNRRAYQCPMCWRSVRSEHRLKLHMAGHERPFQCDICKRSFANRATIRDHMLNHSNSFQYKCKDCDLCFRFATKRLIHWQTVHGGGLKKPYVCDECGRKYVNMSQLRSHQLVHGEKRPFKCPLCDGAFRAKTYVRVHIQRMHTNERPHTCRYDGCTERFRNMDTRVRHEVKVHGESGASLPVIEKGVCQAKDLLNEI